MRRFLLSLALLALGTAAAHATDFWVATTGSDANPGTQASPFLTIGHADQAAVAGFGAGSTVHVAPGTYLGSVGEVTVNGTAASPITYKCDVKWSCFIKPGPSESNNYAWWIGGGAAATKNISAIANSSGLIQITTSATNLLVTGQCGVLVIGATINTNANGRWCVTVSDNTHFTLNGSVFENTSGAVGIVRTGYSGAYTIMDGFDLDGTYPGTGTRWFTMAYTTGIGDVIRNNRIHDVAYPPGSNNGNSGGSCYADGFYGASLAQIYGNLVFHCGPAGTPQGQIHGIYLEEYGDQVYDNLIWGVSGYCVTSNHDATNDTIVNNTMFGCLEYGIGLAAGNPYGFFEKTGTPTNGSAIITGLNTTADLTVNMAVEDLTHPSCIGNASYTAAIISSIDSATQIHISVNAGTTCAASDTLGFDGTQGGSIVRNNLVYGPNITNDWGIAENTGAIGTNTYTNNHIYNSGRGWGLVNGNVHTADISGNPNFVNYQSDGSGDYHVTPGSPDIAAGTATNAPGFDYDGNPVPLGAAPDVGAFAFNPHPHALLDNFWNWLASGFSAAFHKAIYAASSASRQGTNGIGAQTRIFDLDGIGDLWLNGGLTVGWPATGNCGQGCINAQALQVQGVPITPSPVPNPLINASMDFDQQLAAAGTSYSIGAGIGSPVKTLDGWNAAESSAATGLTVQQLSASPPTGFTNYLEAKVGTGNATVGAGDYFLVYQPVEAANTTNYGFGGTGAQPLCFSFYSTSSVSGAIIGGAIQNAARTRSYPFIFSENATPGTWQIYSVCLPGDSAGAWVTSGAAEGMRVVFALEAGSNFAAASAAVAASQGVPGSTFPSIAGTTGAWVGAENYLGATALTQLTKTSTATFDVTGVQLEQSATNNPFRRNAQFDEVQAVQRYAWRLAEPASATNVGTCNMTASGASNCLIILPSTMRAAPGTCSVTAGTFKENIAGSDVTWIPTALSTNTANGVSFTSTAAGGAAGQLAMLKGGGGSGVVFCSARL